MILKKLVPPFRLIHFSMYTEYRKYDKIPPEFKVKGRENLIRLIKAICKSIAKGIYTSKGGVFVEKLGYFFVWKIPKKMPYRQMTLGKGVVEKFNYHSDHYRFSPTFIPSKTKAKVLQRWSMDNAFEKNIRRGIRDKIFNGETFKMYAHSISKFNRG